MSDSLQKCVDPKKIIVARYRKVLRSKHKDEFTGVEAAETGFADFKVDRSGRQELVTTMSSDDLKRCWAAGGGEIYFLNPASTAKLNPAERGCSTANGNLGMWAWGAWRPNGRKPSHPRLAHTVGWLRSELRRHAKGAGKPKRAPFALNRLASVRRRHWATAPRVRCWLNALPSGKINRRYSPMHWLALAVACG